MQMTTLRLILLRIYNVTLGRTAAGASFLRWVLVKVLISHKSREDAYMASSRFFVFGELAAGDGEDRQ